MPPAIYLLAVNIAALAAFWIDKRRAESGERRIPERVLLGLALAGGVLGAVGAQQAFRHKTRKEPFRTLLWAIAVAEAALLAAWLART